MEKLTSKMLSQQVWAMDRHLKLMFANGRMCRQIHSLTKRLTAHSSKCKTCLQKGTYEVTSHRGLCMQMARVLSHSNASQHTPASTTALLTSPAFIKALNSQVYHLHRFHTNNSNFDWERQNQKESSSTSGDKGDNQDEGKKDGEGSDPGADMKRLLYSLTFMTVAFILSYLLTPNQSNNHQYISWNEFYHSILVKGEVKSIRLWVSSEDSEGSFAVIEVLDGAVIKGNLAPPNTRYVIKLPKGFKFENRIREFEDEMGLEMMNRIPITYSDTSQFSTLFTAILIGLAVLSYMAYMSLSKGKKPTGGKGNDVNDIMDMMSGGIRKAKFTRVDIASRGAKAVRFKDVAGLKEAKVEVMEFVDYLTNPQRYQKLGAKTPRGALLLGPPGCGKTLLARALATEAKVPFLAMAGSEFVEMIGGVGAARVRSLFKEARARAPCIIYIDEIDAIGRSRSGSAGGANREDEQTLNQLLVEMDGMGTQEGVIMIAATNRADILDKALLRPGRFDRQVMIDLPTLQEREEIFLVYLKNLKLAQDPSVYAKPLSKLTPGMSGADINNICNEAAIHAAREAHKVIDTKDFEYAVERSIAGVEKRSSDISPAEKKMVAYHESGHALVGWMLEHTDALLRISILPRTNNALGFTQYLPSDQRLYSQEQLFERMCMALGGRVAESLVFNHVSTGAHDDLNRVTQMAYDQIRSYGMNPRIGQLSFPSEKEQSGVRPYSQRLAEIMDEEARHLVNKAYLHTQTVLQQHRDKLNTLATTLLENETLNYEDVEALIGAPPHGSKSKMDPDIWRGMGTDTPDSEQEAPPRRSSRRKSK